MAYPFHTGCRSALSSGGLLLLLLVAAGCATSSSSVRPDTQSASERDTEHRLRAEVEEWRGTPYVIGGNSRSGIDCSGLVQTFYADLFDVDLPRTTEDQVRQGRAVAKDDLQTGDLVFFRPTGRTRHVGIYLSDGAFAHASTSRGVTISHLDRSYWRRSYWTARRVLADAPTDVSEPVADSNDVAPPSQPTTSSSSRTGW